MRVARPFLLLAALSLNLRSKSPDGPSPVRWSSPCAAWHVENGTAGEAPAPVVQARYGPPPASYRNGRSSALRRPPAKYGPAPAKYSKPTCQIRPSIFRDQRHHFSELAVTEPCLVKFDGQGASIVGRRRRRSDTHGTEFKRCFRGAASLAAAMPSLTAAMPSLT